MSGLYSLATLVTRLEATALRLEDIAYTLHPEGSNTGVNPDAPFPPPGLEPPPVVAAPAPPAPKEYKSVTAFEDDVIKGKLQPFLELTRSFASASVIEQAAIVEKGFNDVRDVLQLAASCQKPDTNTWAEVLKPLTADLEGVGRLKDANFKDRVWYNHLEFIAAGVAVLGWVGTSLAPGPYAAEAKDSAVYYGNKVIKEFKEKDPQHVQWVRAYVAVLDETRKYIMEYHTTGLVWNPKGVSVTEHRASSSAAPKAPGGPPPPPPPPPPAPAPPPPAVAGASSDGGAAAVFAALNRGEEVTKGLRKVDKSEMTHKNPALRAGSVVPSTPGSPAQTKKPTKPMKPQKLMSKKPSKFALEGNKWVIEYQENESGLVVEGGEISQTVNLFNCKNSTVVVKGKVNAVTLVNCVKTSILVESVISTVSVTNSPSFTLQITGSAPTIQLDSTDSGQIYLSKDCLGVEITTAKCSSINVSLPVEGEEDGVFEEQAVPEMLKTVVQGGKLVTTVVEHVG